MSFAEEHVATLEALLAAVHADNPKRELLVRIGDAIREAKDLHAIVTTYRGTVDGIEATVKACQGVLGRRAL